MMLISTNIFNYIVRGKLGSTELFPIEPFALLNSISFKCTRNRKCLEDPVSKVIASRDGRFYMVRASVL